MCSVSHASHHYMVSEAHEILQVKVAITTVTILAVFCFIAFVSAFAIPGHRYRKLLVGSIGLAVSIALYASPLVAMVTLL